MHWPLATRRWGIYGALLILGLGVCAWQFEEHTRFKRAAAQALINRGRDITSTLGVVVRSQRRIGIAVSKERVESALQDLVRPGDLESIMILGATGETIAGAGRPVQLTPDMLRARGIYWREETLTLMNLMDLGHNASEERSRAPLVVSDPRLFRPNQTRRPADAPPVPELVSPNLGANAARTARSPFGRPAWMSPEEYESVIQKQGVHSLVIALSTVPMRQAVQNDLLLRSLISLLTCAVATASALASRNFGKNADLQIRLVKAGEMNTHLAAMNLAAAGLAHETRNPLNLIRGLAQLITMQAQDAPQLKEHAATIIEEADRVTVQLNEFINYSKPREAHLAPVAATGLVADVARTLLPDLEEKQIQLSLPESPLTIEADEQLFRQALFNLLLNAVQAVEIGGHIEIRWSSVAPREAVLEIRDDGIGVPAAERTAIFKPYVTMRPKGVGLGLAIVHQIVAAHRWEIVCEPNQPRGAVFRISHLKVAAPNGEL